MPFETELPSPLLQLVFPVWGMIFLVLGFPLARFLTRVVERFSYDDSFFDPERGPRPQEHYFYSDLEDLSGLPFRYRIPFFGLLVGMFEYSRFGLLRGAERCSVCAHPLDSKDTFPLLNHLRLGGRCQYCQAEIPKDLFWIEWWVPLFCMGAGLLFGPTLQGILALVLLGVVVVSTVVDWRYQIIPDEVSTFGFCLALGIGLAHSAVAWIQLGSLPPGPWWEAPFLTAPFHLLWVLGGTLTGSLVLWLFGVLGSRMAGTTAMGGGDTKLAFSLGGYLGPFGSLMAILVAGITGTLAGLLIMASGGGTREQGFTKFAFGPYIGLGALVVYALGSETTSMLVLRGMMAFSESLNTWLFGPLVFP